MEEVEFSHHELSLALFALEGGTAPSVPVDPCSTASEDCPIVEQLEETFGWRGLSPAERLARHLSKHLRQAWVESGLLDLQKESDLQISKSDMTELQRRMEGWRCSVVLEAPDRGLLYEAIAKLPRSAWIAMPRTMWRLKRKLRR
ncbi:MAG TPA: hypothetical protein VI756_27170 [Blastocatellia bacterium]